MDITELIENFASALYSREGILTEDNIRYYLFACMLRQDPDLNHYTLELPYQTIAESGYKDVKLKDNHDLKIVKPENTENTDSQITEGKLNQELDMFYDNGLQRFCIEIKFHRRIKGGTTFPHTMAVGELFNDIRRLQVLTTDNKNVEFRKFVLYVTDEEMHQYMGMMNTRKSDKTSFRESLKNFYENGIIYFNDESIVPKVFKEYSSKSFQSYPAKQEIASNLIYSRDIECNNVTSIYKDGVAYCYIKLYEITE